MSMDGFLAVHSGLHREGPGTAADVAWATAEARTPPDARVCDAACGPGADVEALRAAAPDGTVLAFDRHLPFVAQAASRHRRDPAVTVSDGLLIGAGDPVACGPFDLIWCAGAVYFEGVERTLSHWRAALRPGGAVAFSHPVNFAAPDADMRAFWDGATVGDEDALEACAASAIRVAVAEARREAAEWRRLRDRLGYALRVVRPT